MHAPIPIDREVPFRGGDIIVSKTDLVGRITYANKTFCLTAGYREAELIGRPHSIIRHPDMPRAVFKLLWDTIGSGKEIFAYVKNATKSGEYYWVFAHVTPSFDRGKNIVAYHSNRRVPRREAIRAIEPLYASVLAEERRHKNGKEALAAGVDCVVNALRSQGKSYEEFVLAL